MGDLDHGCRRVLRGAIGREELFCRALSEHHFHGSGDRRLRAALTIFYGALVPVGLFRLEFSVP
jgi:hypothetical protein